MKYILLIIIFIFAECRVKKKINDCNYNPSPYLFFESVKRMNIKKEYFDSIIKIQLFYILDSNTGKYKFAQYNNHGTFPDSYCRLIIPSIVSDKNMGCYVEVYGNSLKYRKRTVITRWIHKVKRTNHSKIDRTTSEDNK